MIAMQPQPEGTIMTQYISPATCTQCHNPPAPGDDLCYACRAAITPPAMIDIFPARRSCPCGNDIEGDSDLCADCFRARLDRESPRPNL